MKEYQQKTTGLVIGLLMAVASVQGQGCLDNSSGSFVYSNNDVDLTRRPTTMTTTMSPDLTPGIISSFGAESQSPGFYPGFIQLSFDSTSVGTQGFIIEMSDGENYVMGTVNVTSFLSVNESLADSSNTYILTLNANTIDVYFQNTNNLAWSTSLLETEVADQWAAIYANIPDQASLIYSTWISANSKSDNFNDEESYIMSVQSTQLSNGAGTTNQFDWQTATFGVAPQSVNVKDNGSTIYEFNANIQGQSLTLKASNQHASSTLADYSVFGTLSIDNTILEFDSPPTIWIDISNLDSTTPQLVSIMVPVTFSKASMFISFFGSVDIPNHEDEGINISMYLQEINYPYRKLTNTEIVQLVPFSLIQDEGRADTSETYQLLTTNDADAFFQNDQTQYARLVMDFGNGFNPNLDYSNALVYIEEIWMTPQCDNFWNQYAEPPSDLEPKIIFNTVQNEIVTDEDWKSKYDIALGVMIPLILIMFAVMILFLLKFLKAKKEASAAGQNSQPKQSNVNQQQVDAMKKEVEYLKKQMVEEEEEWRLQTAKHQELEKQIALQLQAERKIATKKADDDDDILAIDDIDAVMSSPEKRMYSGKASANKTDETSNIPPSSRDDNLEDDEALDEDD